MVIDNEQELYEERDLYKKVIEKAMFKPRMKDVDGKIYKVEKLYPHFVLMSTEFGYKRCFKYGEVWYRLK